jgi:hypothetical protein
MRTTLEEGYNMMRFGILRYATVPALSMVLAGSAFAASGISAPPMPPSGTELGETSIEPVSLEQLKGPAGRVDDVLSKLSSKLTGPVTDPVQDEQDFNRALNYTRQGGTMLKPVGYSEVNGKRVMYVATEQSQGSPAGQGGSNASLQRLEEGNSVGTIKIDRVSVAGLEYTAGTKKIFAPLTLIVTEPPKAPTVVNAGGRATTGSTADTGKK